MRSILVSPLVLFVIAGIPARAADFEPLFDGMSLDGWTGNPALWSVEDGAIKGSTEGNPIKKNSFLSTTKRYPNFVLRLKFKLRNGNSGVQYRSRQHDDYVVRGYQADIAEQTFMGILYEEGGRGILAPADAEQVYQHAKAGDWNEYVITADGPNITHAINGYTTIRYEEKSDEGATDGIIALQLHVGPPMVVWFKDIEIKPLP